MSDPTAFPPSSTARVGSRLAAGVLHLSLRRPEVGNALDYPMMMALAELTAAANDHDGVRCILLSGDGEHFCTGDTPGAMGPWPERFAHRRPAGAHGAPPVVEQHMLRTVRAVAKPVVAALKGEVMGLGLDLAAVCDFRVASDTAQIGDPRVLQGRYAATGISYVLPRLIGLSRASWMLLTGETVTAPEAARFGLAHRVCAPGALDGEAEALAAKLAALPTRSFAVKKEMTLAQLDMSFEAAMMHCLAVRQTNVIEDKAEGIAAWRERRPPRFTGR